jgi:small-conductance mechanosensitive channel
VNATFAMTGRPLNWLERVLVFLAAACLAVLGFFFLTVALIAGTLVASAVLVRWWWLARKLHRTRAQTTLDGEYEVVEHSASDQVKLPRDRE